MPTRRSHSNSHHGCLQCKQRRVKEQPKCARCVRRGAECTYRHMMSNYNPFQPPTTTSRHTPQSQPPSSSTTSSTPFLPSQTQPPQPLKYVFHSPETPKAAARAADEQFIKPEPATPQPIPSNTPPLPSNTVPSTPLFKPQVWGQLPLPESPKVATETPRVKRSDTLPPTTPMEPEMSSTASSRPVIKTEPSPDSDMLSEQSYPAGPSSLNPTIPPSEITFTTERDAYLMQHYTTHLSTPSMSPILEASLFPTLSTIIMNHAQTVPYVRHVVLAFSGLHLASYSASAESAKYLYTALAHKDAALQLFRPAVMEGITPETAEPQLAASAVLVACCLALPAADPGRRMDFDRIDILAEVAGLFQGTNHIYNHHAFQNIPRKLSSGSETSSFDSNSSPPKSPGDNVPWKEAMDSLQKCIDRLNALPATENQEEFERRDVIYHAYEKLQKTFGKVSEGRRDINCMWLGKVNKHFVSLIIGRDPMALLLMAHWAVCRTDMDRVWWAQGWPAAATSAIHEALDDNHRPLLDWCLSQVRRTPLTTWQQQRNDQTAHFQQGST